MGQVRPWVWGCATRLRAEVQKWKGGLVVGGWEGGYACMPAGTSGVGALVGGWERLWVGGWVG